MLEMTLLVGVWNGDLDHFPRASPVDSDNVRYNSHPCMDLNIHPDS